MHIIFWLVYFTDTDQLSKKYNPPPPKKKKKMLNIFQVIYQPLKICSEGPFEELWPVLLEW